MKLLSIVATLIAHIAVLVYIIAMVNKWDHVQTGGASVFIAITFALSALPTIYLARGRMYLAKLFGTWILMGATLVVAAFVGPMLLPDSVFSSGLSSPFFSTSLVSMVAGGYYVGIGTVCAILLRISQFIFKVRS